MEAQLAKDLALTTTSTAAAASRKEHTGFGQDQRRRRNRILLFAILLMALAIVAALLVTLSLGASSTTTTTAGGVASIGGGFFSFGRTTSRSDFALVAEMSVMPGYDGPLEPKGNVHFLFDQDNHFLLTMRMQGLEVACVGCAVKVHSHTSCADTPGVPFWNHAALSYNPWHHTHYHTDPSGHSHTAIATYTGHDASVLEHKLVLVYNREDQPVACGVLHTADLVTRGVRTLHTTIHNHPVYHTTPITGNVHVQFFPDDTLVLHLQLDGLPPHCVECKIAIQEGTDCHRTYQGNHYWNRGELERDPWAVARGAYYSSDGNGHAERSFFLYNGYGHEENTNHAVVVSDSTGTRIGCGILTARVGQKTPHTLPPMPGQD